MLIAIIGENCSGKTTLANALGRRINAEIITGKDYLRMAKSESEATLRFKEKLKAAVSGNSVIYVITEKEQISFLPEGAKIIYAKADLATIKARFTLSSQMKIRLNSF